MHEESSELQCRECVELLADYVDGTLPKDQAELLDWHLDGCAPCVAFVNTYKGTVDAARRLRDTRIPPELHRKLIDFLRSFPRPESPRA
jgi:anti-sigma factor RsiW